MMVQIYNIYLLKDLSRLSGYSIHTLKFYLKLGLIKEAGRSPQTRFRYFDDTTVERLAKIRVWRKEKKSLDEIQQLLNMTTGSQLEAQGSGPPASSFQPPASAVE
jgi:DNA-binding transcriptional MerR regulator